MNNVRHKPTISLVTTTLGKCNVSNGLSETNAVWYEDEKPINSTRSKLGRNQPNPMAGHPSKDNKQHCYDDQ